MALVLARREGESIVLELPMDLPFDGDRQIVVRVKRIDAGRVSLGIDAPRSVKILRAELEPLPRLIRLRSKESGEERGTRSEFSFSHP